MTDSNYTHIAIVADKSGSMGGMSEYPSTKAKDTTVGVHELVRDQRDQPGKVTFSLTDFNTKLRDVAWFTDGRELLPRAASSACSIHEEPSLYCAICFPDDFRRGWECIPGGNTALNDAVGHTITRLGEHLKGMTEASRPGRVIIVIATDGLENSSVEYSKPQIKSMIEHQKTVYGWDVIYIGVDIDAFKEGGQYGVPFGSTMSASAAATADVYAVTSEAIRSSRASGQSVSYSGAQRERVASKGKPKDGK